MDAANLKNRIVQDDFALMLSPGPPFIFHYSLILSHSPLPPEDSFLYQKLTIWTTQLGILIGFGEQRALAVDGREGRGVREEICSLSWPPERLPGAGYFP